MAISINDTIAAISTPIGEGGIGIVRISGSKSEEIGMKILRTVKGRKFIKFEDHRVYYGRVINPVTEAVIDEVLFFYAQNPHSFTAEDTIEIQAHGGSVGVSEILNIALENGARLAEPGEFTKRAFLNGRIDLVQAESIIDLIRAKTDKAHQIALSQLTGKAAQGLYQIETELYHILISIEALLDFPEEGIPELQKNNILTQISRIEVEFIELIAKIDEGRKISEGLMIVIAGQPNVGKSSLLNAFIQEERAIVTEIPGTTRDIIEAQVQLRGIPIRIIDTAGIRATDNLIEKKGIEKAEQYLDQADLILFLLDGSKKLSKEDQEITVKVRNKPVLTIINKTDLPKQISAWELKELGFDNVIELSLMTKKGFEQLEEKIVNLVGIGEISVDDRPLLSRVRHKQALQKGLESLKSFEQGMQLGLSEDLLAVDLRASLEAIGEITGKNVSEEVLHGIFAQFCIGK